MRVGQDFNPNMMFVGSFIPEWLERCQELSCAQKMVYARLARYAGKNGRAFPSQDTLAEALAISRQHVTEAIGVLEEKGFLRVIRPTGRDRLMHKPNRYRFVWQEIMESSLRSPDSGSAPGSKPDQRPDANYSSARTQTIPAPNGRESEGEESQNGEESHHHHNARDARDVSENDGGDDGTDNDNDPSDGIHDEQSRTHSRYDCIYTLIDQLDPAVKYPPRKPRPEVPCHLRDEAWNKTVFMAHLQKLSSHGAVCWDLIKELIDLENYLGHGCLDIQSDEVNSPAIGLLEDRLQKLPAGGAPLPPLSAREWKELKEWYEDGWNRHRKSQRS